MYKRRLGRDQLDRSASITASVQSTRMGCGGESIEEVAGFLCRSGTVEEVRRKAEELGLLRSK